MKRAALLALAAAGAVSSRAAAQGLAKVRIVTLPIDLGAEAYYAADMGFFTAGGLDAEVTTLNFGQAIASAIAGGAADIGQSNIVSLATAYERGLDVALVAPAGYYLAKAPTSMLIVPKTSALRNARDFSGKTVAVNGLKNITELSVRFWIDQNGGDSGAVKFLELPFAEMGAALDAGRADAALMAEPDATELLGAGRTRAFVSTFDAIGKSFIIGGWFAPARGFAKTRRRCGVSSP
jgi:NitT/TauT family transport system substrate-binding protein